MGKTFVHWNQPSSRATGDKTKWGESGNLTMARKTRRSVLHVMILLHMFKCDFIELLIWMATSPALSEDNNLDLF
jgi:hypothetical protein